MGNKIQKPKDQFKTELRLPSSMPVFTYIAQVLKGIFYNIYIIYTNSRPVR